MIERLDLFIDLLWVGIISNISEHFFEQSFSGGVESGRALIEFFLLFLPAWGIWSELQMFLSSYYMDDFAQRLIVMWILILGLFWGNNAPYILGTNETVSWFISVYIIATLSLRLVELLYSIWLPWLRRIWLWRAILTLPVTGFWLAAIFTKHDIQLGMIFATIAFERAWIFLEASPIGDRLWGGNNHIRKYHDYKHTIKRFESFFIITLGEGVFLLVRGSPLGSGFNQHASRGVWALMIYYLVHWTYFYGDHTRTLVHPVYRRWYLRVAWTFLHIPLFMSTVLLSSSMLYLVDYTKEGETNGTAEGAAVRVKRAESSTCPMGGTETAGGRGEKRIERRAEGEACTNHHTLRIATVTAFMSLAVILFTQTALALLNKPLDKPKTLLVNSRYIRLAPRVLAVVALFVMWVCDWQDPNAIIGFMALVCWLVFAWEANVGRERGGGIFEPKLSGRE